MNDVVLEICCGSADDVVQAQTGGADRVELNSALFLGGLTPTVGALRTARKHAEIEIIAMARPREGGFCYTDLEFETMLRDAKKLIKAGADGIAFGCLNADGTVDEARCAKMVEVIGVKQSVFHRAFDVTPDWRRALDALISLGVTRVLSSGQQPLALLGVDTLREMRAHAAGRIEILPGAGIDERNALTILSLTGLDQLHMSRARQVSDPSASGNAAIHFGGALYPSEISYKVTDCDAVLAVKCAIDGAEFVRESPPTP